MSFLYPLDQLISADLFDTLLPDFVIGFAFFTSVIYAVLGRRFGHQRPAVVMSAALGLALTVGLVWWEFVNGFSIKNLGPLAAGFAVILLAGVMYQAIRQVGGSWAGAGIAVGASLLVGWTMGFSWPVDAAVVQSLMIVTLTVGTIAFLLHRRGPAVQAAHGKYESAAVRHDLSDVYDDYRVGHRLRRGFHHLRQGAKHLQERPEVAADIRVQLKRMLPAEGWLTERLAKLREKMYLVKQGHLLRVEGIQAHYSELSPKAKKKAHRELMVRFKELALDERLERLDKACAENERRVRELTQQADSQVEAGDQPKLLDTLTAAEKLQGHNEKLFKLIDQTERRLMRLANAAAPAKQEVKTK